MFTNFILLLKCFQDKEGALENFPIIHYSKFEKPKQRNKPPIYLHLILWNL